MQDLQLVRCRETMREYISSSISVKYIDFVTLPILGILFIHHLILTSDHTVGSSTITITSTFTSASL